MTTVAIIGAGEIGGTIAGALAQSGAVDRILLIDDADDVAAGKALDIRQAGAITRSHTGIESTDEVAAAAGCHVCVVADPAGHGEERKHGHATRPLLARLAACVGIAPVVFAGLDQAAMLDTAATDAGMGLSRLIGSGPLAMTAAVTSIVAMEAGCSPREVSLVVLGAPPGGFVVPWSQVAIAGLALERVLTPPQVTRLEARLVRLWPLGPYVLGVAAARAIEAILSSSRSAAGVLTMLDGAFGVRGRVGTVPALLTPGGIARVMEPVLTPRELTQVQTALEKAG